jgi:ketosteroid isomerase-like protein
MAHENEEVVREGIAAFNERDPDGYIALCTDDVELISVFAAMEGAHRGAEGIRRFFAELDEVSRDYRLEIEALEAVSEDRVLALLKGVGSGRFSGASSSFETANVYDLENGKIRRVRVYLDRDEAREAVGLRQA